MATIHECAKQCHGIAAVFAYGTNDFGKQGCNSGLCKCKCVVKKKTWSPPGMVDENQECKQVNDESYWFFRYKPEANFGEKGKD